ncbi:DUF2188 domain-containing protein [Mucilaginibacter ginkgonis]|uniref:DUF2188 domain-containing protein n=1 Tax=Mucilaginibacter ginkgonis TaxID=2682091 RepID=A0A6I4HVD1_9SPHI|nr:DUF2188 domain-containing protein [Mucilaginibacter ginkgonis]QQL49897.1 DUF2188 domain-containing protein [Mucilaginibacter ginkgonis]
MAAKKNVHVVPNSDGGWDAKRESAQRSSKHFDKKADAVDYGKDLAKKDKVEFIPHGKDGKIQNPNSYGNDPNPPRDKKN